MNKKPYLFLAILYSSCLFLPMSKTNFNSVKEVRYNSIDYTKDDLIFESLTVVYDGKEHSLIASCPINWDVTYNKENTYKEVGIYEIEARFTDLTNTYNDVKKIATLTIFKEEKPNYLPIILCSTIIPVGCIGIDLTTYFLISYIKKKKYTKPL